MALRVWRSAGAKVKPSTSGKLSGVSASNEETFGRQDLQVGYGERRQEVSRRPSCLDEHTNRSQHVRAPTCCLLQRVQYSRVWRGDVPALRDERGAVHVPSDRLQPEFAIVVAAHGIEGAMRG